MRLLQNNIKKPTIYFVQSNFMSRWRKRSRGWLASGRAQHRCRAETGMLATAA